MISPRFLSRRARKSLKHMARMATLSVVTFAMTVPPVYAVQPLRLTGVPDVNVLGLLDGGDPTYDPAQWGEPITNIEKRTALQQLGKLLFWDMQVGGDGTIACASCHFTAGADNRITNQMSPGLRRTEGGANNQFESPDKTHQLLMANLPGGPNGTLSVGDFGGHNGEGLPVSENAVIGAGGTADDPLDGTPGPAVPLGALAGIAGTDVNDVVSSAGPRLVSFEGPYCVDGTGLATSCDELDAVDYPDGIGDLNALPDEGNGFTPGRQDHGVLDTQDEGFDDAQGGTGAFFDGFTTAAVGIPDTTRHVEPRNTNTMHNAIFNLRSFHDGRADMFFNGVNPLGFRDPSALVTIYDGGVATERMNVPFSSLASQAVGPIESVLEMVGHTGTGGGRPNHNLGRKMVEATPLFNQLVACDDPLLSSLVPGCVGSRYIPATVTYRSLIEPIFAERFWGNGSGDDVCLEAPDFNTEADFVTDCGIGSPNRLLIEKNFQIFFALSIQAYEATQFTGETIVDLLAGGIIGFDGSACDGNDSNFNPPISTVITNGTGRNRKVVDVGCPFPVGNQGRPNAPGPNQHLTLEQCVALVRTSTAAAQVAIAEDLCTLKFAQFIHPKAESGTESNLAPFPGPGFDPVEPGVNIGSCNPPDSVFDGLVNTSPNSLGLFQFSDACKDAQATLLNIDRGLGRFEAGATACIVCHFSANFTGATVPIITGFGAPPPDPFIAPGALRREEPPAMTERMIKFDGGIAVYDAGFYNIAVRPTAEDLAIGAPIDVGNGEVPLSLAKLKEQIAVVTAAAAGAGDPDAAADAAAEEGLDGSAILKIASTIDGATAPGKLQFPTSMQVGTLGTTNLAPIPFNITLACGPGLVGGGNGAGAPNNNPNVGCVPDIIPGEFILRNGAFKAQGLRNARYTGPHFHNGSKMNLRQVFDFYKNIGDLTPGVAAGFPNLSLANLDAGLRIIGLAPDQEAAVIEMMETGLTDWASVHEQGKFSHPQLCVAVGHDPATGESIMADLHVSGAVGAGGNTARLATFEEVLNGGGGHEHDFSEDCTMPGVAFAGTSDIDVPPAAAP